MSNMKVVEKEGGRKRERDGKEAEGWKRGRRMEKISLADSVEKKKKKKGRKSVAPVDMIRCICSGHWHRQENVIL